jgi:hypothetical protein
MMEKRPELPVPPDAAVGEGSFEVLRAWLGLGTLHCSLRPEIWPEPENWGVLLADVARYVALALEERVGAPRETTLRTICDAFEGDIADGALLDASTMVT